MLTQKKTRFFVGTDRLSIAGRFDDCFISVNTLKPRKSDFCVNNWIMDSGAFTEISRHGRYRDTVDAYVEQMVRWSRCGNLLAAVSQDYMCEDFILLRTGLDVADHQRLTIERYDAITRLSPPVYVMPVLQGYQPAEYASHIDQYGPRLQPGMWVGVGSVCKRNTSIHDICAVLLAIKKKRPDLRLHGFGIKKTALRDGFVNEHLYSSDSMAWSFAARYEGRNKNDWQEAERYRKNVAAICVQGSLLDQLWGL